MDVKKKEVATELLRIKNMLYILFFVISIILFTQKIYQFYIAGYFSRFDYNFLQTFLFFLLFLLSYLECIWKFYEKSSSRKFFNLLFLMFSSLFWLASSYSSSNGAGGSLEGLGQALMTIFYLFIALFFYIISLIIAAVELIKRRISNPASSLAAPKKQTIIGGN